VSSIDRPNSNVTLCKNLLQSFATNPMRRESPWSTLSLGLEALMFAMDTVAAIGLRTDCKSFDLEPFITCLIQSKSMTPASDAPSAFEPVPRTFLKWFPGMAVKQLKSHPRLGLRTVLVANVAKRLAPPTSSVSGSIWVRKQLAAWVWRTRVYL
jgi:hypothetical protein